MVIADLANARYDQINLPAAVIVACANATGHEEATNLRAALTVLLGTSPFELKTLDQHAADERYTIEQITRNLEDALRERNA